MSFSIMLFCCFTMSCARLFALSTDIKADPHSPKCRWTGNIEKWKSDSLLYNDISKYPYYIWACVVSPSETGKLKHSICEIYVWT